MEEVQQTTQAVCLLGLPSIGIDNSPVAVALSQAKLANTTHLSIMQVVTQILEEISTPQNIPLGEFWDWAYHKEVLHTLCRLREGLLKDCQSEARKALRAIILGALHGPCQKVKASYFSNQSQRTYAPKPRYAVKYWKLHNLYPQYVDVLNIIETRAIRYYQIEATQAVGKIIQGDSREQNTYTNLAQESKLSWVITSPPYYGMRTYIPDQWLRVWFLGGAPQVDYSAKGQVSHASPDAFVSDISSVWRNVGSFCRPGAKLVVRFGAIHDRKVDSLSLLQASLKNSGWTLISIESAGSASIGRRQALHFSHAQKGAIEEHDIWGIRED